MENQQIFVALPCNSGCACSIKAFTMATRFKLYDEFSVDYIADAFRQA